MDLVNYSSSFWSIIPASLALILAILTRKVLFSLSVGILVGAFMLAPDFLGGFTYLKKSIVGLVYSENEWSLGKLQIIIFLLLLGVFTSLLTFFRK